MHALAIAAAVLSCLFGLFWLSTYHPERTQDETACCSGKPPRLRPGRTVKVMSWNAQYFAGKNYVFWYEAPPGVAGATRPRAEDVAATLRGAAETIAAQDPDIVLLQEIDHGAARTGRTDQLAELLKLLPESYRCHASAFYWKAAFVPHPKIMGPVGMKLSTISKFAMKSAARHQLPLMPVNFVERQFNLKRAVLSVRFALEGGGEIAVMNTHLEAFAQGYDTMERQAKAVLELMKSESARGVPCMIGGDFNLLACEKAYERLSDSHRRAYRPGSELQPMLSSYPSVPGLKDIEGDAFEQWHTYCPNGSDAPDRTIDYIFFSKDIAIGESRVLQNEAMALSDHLPVVATFRVP